MGRYKVNGKAEEFDCPTCGAPVYNGDGAWEDEGTAYCSAYCAGADPRRNGPKVSLAVELRDAWEGEGNSSRITFRKWLKAMADNPRGTLQQAAKDYLSGKR